MYYTKNVNLHCPILRLISQHSLAGPKESSLIQLEIPCKVFLVASYIGYLDVFGSLTISIASGPFCLIVAVFSRW